MFRTKNHKKIKLPIYIITIFVFIITLFGCINIYKSCKIINNQAETNFIYLTGNVEQKQNEYFRKAEEVAERCKNMIEITIDGKKLNKIVPTAYKYSKDQIPYVESYLNSTVSPLLLYSAKNIEGLVGIYFNFDHELIVNKDIIGLWYTDINLNGNFQPSDNGPASSMYPKNNQELDWFYEPEKLKKGLWDQTYTDKDMKIDMVTYSTPVYIGKKFIGIIGVDLSMDQIKNFIYQLKIYETGKAYLMDKNNKIIFAKDHKTSTSSNVIDKNLYNFLNNASTKDSLKLKTEGIRLVKSSSGKKLFAVSELYNGFVLVLEVPTNELYAQTINLIVFASYLLILAVLVISLITIQANRYITKINNGLIHKEKLMSMGTIVAEIAHEINNPIGFVSCNLDTLKNFLGKIKILISFYEEGLNKILTKESTIENEIGCINNLKTELKSDYVINSIDELIDESKEGINRVAQIVVNLKKHAVDNGKDVKSSENIEKLILDALIFLGNKIKPDVEIIKKFSDLPPLHCHKNQMGQVLINLLDNACYSVEKKGHSNKKINISTYKKGSNAYIEIEDNGTGIEKDKIGRIFDTFYTTKGDGEGTGLGLSISNEIITKKHKGEILVESEKDKGTKFIIKIPY